MKKSLKQIEKEIRKDIKMTNNKEKDLIPPELTCETEIINPRFVKDLIEKTKEESLTSFAEKIKEIIFDTGYSSDKEEDRGARLELQEKIDKLLEEELK